MKREKHTIVALQATIIKSTEERMMSYHGNDLVKANGVFVIKLRSQCITDYIRSIMISKLASMLKEAADPVIR